jgi:cytochrome b561
MYNEKKANNGTVQFHEKPDSYGWISIVLHWMSAALIISLWFIGQSISGQASGEMDARLSLHVTIATLAWIFLLIRIIWRISVRHPHIDGQSTFISKVARTTHYLMLVVLAVMLVSGPILAWAGGKSILILGKFNFPMAATHTPELAEAAFAIHSLAATILFALLVLHILGALKQLMFNDDDTIVRMLRPKRR